MADTSVSAGSERQENQSVDRAGAGRQPPRFGVLLRPLVSAAVLLAAGVLWGCHDPDRYLLTSAESIPMEQLFTLNVEGDSTLPADGYSAVRLVARIRDVSEGSRSVLFVTSAGSLRVGSVVAGDSAVVPAGPQGEAIVELVSIRQAVTARVRASVVDVVPNLVQERSVRFTPVTETSVIRFVDSPDSALADGIELVPLTVRIASALEGEDRQVTFETTQGVFAFAKDNSQDVVIMADTSDLATAYLRGPDRVTEALVKATVKGFTQETKIRFVPVPASRVLRFVEAPVSAIADGATLSRFRVEIAPELQGDADRTVEFETTHGTFLLAQGSSKVRIVADASNVANAFLQSPVQIAEAVVTATVKSFVQQQTIAFVWAAPDTISLSIETNKLNLKASEQIQLKAELIRDEGRGTVTKGMEVSFTATDTLGEPIEGVRFLNVTRTDDQGKASAVFAPDNTTYRGPVTITARPAKLNLPVAGHVVLRIVSP